MFFLFLTVIILLLPQFAIIIHKNKPNFYYTSFGKIHVELNTELILISSKLSCLNKENKKMNINKIFISCFSNDNYKLIDF